MTKFLKRGPLHRDATSLAGSRHLDVMRPLMADADAQWSAGTFGAIAEFLRDPEEPVTFDHAPGRISAATPRGALCLNANPDVRLVAYETVSRDANSWRHSIALCLPEATCAMSRRTVVTELGPDLEAVRAQDRGGLLFDIGLGLSQTDACIRTSDTTLVAAMRASAGRALFDHDNPVLMNILRAGPHRVFLSRLGRLEVFQPIPPPHGKSPPGPHTHILPKLLRANRTHAATTPIPAGWVPCANVYPGHALLDANGMPRAFDHARFDAFNALLAHYGNPDLVALQGCVAAAVARGAAPDNLQLPAGKFARATVRVSLRKLKAAGASAPVLESWFARFDRASDDDGEEEAQHTC